MPRKTILVLMMALAAFVVAGLSTVFATSNSTATLNLVAKTDLDMLIKNEVVTVAVEMDHFKVENNLGYLAWEATVCWNAKVFQLQGDPTNKGVGPQGNIVAGPQFSGGTDILCQSVGASVGPGEAGAVDKGNLINFDFICITAEKNIDVHMDGKVITGDKKSHSGQSGKVTFDCRTARMSASGSGGFYTEPADLIDKSGPNPKAGAIQVKDGTIKVVISIDDLKTLVDKDSNPVDGGGYTLVGATLNYNAAVIEVQQVVSGKNAAALVPCTGSGNAPDADVTSNAGNIVLLCESDKSQLVSDENQGAGDVFTVSFECEGLATEAQTDITLSGTLINDEDNSSVNHFTESAVITVICIGGGSDLDGDKCRQGFEDAINEITLELFGIEFMDKNIYDYPDTDGNLIITIVDVLAYVQDFGRNDPNLSPATNQGEKSDPIATVHDVSQPNDSSIGADDILRAALLFGTPCFV